MSRKIDINDLSEFIDPAVTQGMDSTEFLRHLILDTLHDNVCQVTFTKEDGTERIMLCSLLEDKIPEDKVPKGIQKIANLEVIRAFDLEKNGWRSFRVDSVKTVEF